MTKGRALLIASALAFGLAAVSPPAMAHDPGDQTEQIGSCAPASFDDTSPQADVRFMRVDNDKAGQLMLPNGAGVRQDFIDQGGAVMSRDAASTAEAEVCFTSILTTSQAGTTPDEPRYHTDDEAATGEAKHPDIVPSFDFALAA
jgi:hypothetical protein